MPDNPLSFSPPCLGDEEISEVVEVLRSDWISSGPRVEQFELEFASFVGTQGAVALNSGTAALHLALLGHGVGPGDVVLTTPLAFCSVAHVIEHTGATPLFVDIEPDTLNIDPKALATELERIRPSQQASGTENRGRPSAILCVHYGGHPCDMAAIRPLAEEQGLAVVEDAAHALPARYENKLIGAPVTGPPTAVGFSFYATKNLTTGEGGMLVGPPEVLDHARVLSLHGITRSGYERSRGERPSSYDVTGPGFKYNMSDIQAAIGLAQLRKLGGFHARRREIAQRYTDAFKDLEQLQVPIVRPEADHAWHLYALRLNLETLRLSRDAFIAELGARNIGSSVHFIPIHTLSYYRDRYGFEPEDFPVAYGEYRRLVSLPLHPGLSNRDADDVIEAVAGIVDAHRR